MRKRVLTTFMLVPGPWRDAPAVVAALQRHGIRSLVRSDDPPAAGEIRVEVVVDEDLGEGFSWGRRGPLPDDLVESIARCGRAALVEVAASLAAEPGVFGEVGRALWREGGLAVRMEGSGAASEWEPWLEQIDTGTPQAVFYAAVDLVQGANNTYFTCGMHQFDMADAQVEAVDPAVAVGWLDTFNVFQLAESPVLGSGHTFSPAAGDPVRTLERWPDHRHHPSDGRHNPFGLWRLLLPAEARVEAVAIPPVIIPALVAVLAAKEQEAGAPLTPAEVAAIVDESPCIAMRQADAITLERSRGYADLEPELAWEQWQIVRGGLS